MFFKSFTINLFSQSLEYVDNKKHTIILLLTSNASKYIYARP